MSVSNHITITASYVIPRNCMIGSNNPLLAEADVQKQSDDDDGGVGDQDDDCDNMAGTGKKPFDSRTGFPAHQQNVEYTFDLVGGTHLTPAAIGERLAQMALVEAAKAASDILYARAVKVWPPAGS